MENLLLEIKSEAESIRFNNPSPGKKFVWPRGFKQDAVHLINHHKLTYKQIANATGISPSTIYGWVNSKKSFKKVKILGHDSTQINTPSKISISWDSGVNISGLNFSNLESLLKQGLL